MDMDEDGELETQAVPVEFGGLDGSVSQLEHAGVRTGPFFVWSRTILTTVAFDGSDRGNTGCQAG